MRATRLFIHRTITGKRCITTTTVYGIGEGWTGALGTGRLDQVIEGHNDELTDNAEHPVEMYSTGFSVISCSVGWGHTALIVHDSTTTTKNEKNKLLVTGRPHDFQALLRLRRLPSWLRDYIVERTYTTTRLSKGNKSLHPVDLIGRILSFLSDQFIADVEDWETAAMHSFLKSFTELSIPTDDSPVSVRCSAGLSAVLSESGKLYTFGLNGHGQCGLGYQSTNVWKPGSVTGLSTEFATGKRSELEQSHPIVSVALGLQHGICLNRQGEIFTWGKGHRGQLGTDIIEGESDTATPITKSLNWHKMESVIAKPIYERLGTISQISSGMIHSAAMDRDNNHVYVWGKHVIPLPPHESKTRTKVASDARLPVRVLGLPEHLQVIQIACGSHHTSMLLEDGSVWAIGVTTDTKRPQHTPIQLIEAGVIELPVRQFGAHMDRTTIVGHSGRQVLQVQLWEDEISQEYAVFTPAWLDVLMENEPNIRIREVHRSWLHTVIVTEKESNN